MYPWKTVSVSRDFSSEHVSAPWIAHAARTSKCSTRFASDVEEKKNRVVKVQMNDVGGESDKEEECSRREDTATGMRFIDGT